MRSSLLFLTTVFLFVACSTDSDPAPKCTTKAITYQEFKDNYKPEEKKEKEIVESVQSHDKK
jgi:hypothetical protein